MIYIILLFVIAGVFYYLNLPSTKGKIGEKKVKRVLNKLALKLNGFELWDVMLGENDKSSQIDNLLVTNKGIYVIEVKNYSGWIFGDELSLNWTQTIKHVNKKKSKSGKVYKKTHMSKRSFYNPIKQNATHIKRIKEELNLFDNIKVYNIVVFGNGAKLKKVKTKSQNTMVINIRDINKLVHKLEQTSKVCINDKSMKYIEDKLNEYNIIDRKSRRNHVKRIKKKYN